MHHLAKEDHPGIAFVTPSEQSLITEEVCRCAAGKGMGELPEGNLLEA